MVVGVVGVLVVAVIGVVLLTGSDDSGDVGSEEATGMRPTTTGTSRATTTTAGEASTTTETTEPADVPAEGPPLGEPTAPPTGGWSSFDDELAANCHGGNMVDCDYLYENIQGIQLPDSQPHKDYGATCGGRIAEPANGNCVTWYGTEL